MKILIVDDETNKLGAIKNIIKEINEIKEGDVFYAVDLINARKSLLNTHFDLLIIDLCIPEEIGEKITSKIAGLDFLEEIIKINNYIKPKDILIITSFDESNEEYKTKEKIIDFPIIKYDPLVKDWERIIKSRIQYHLIYEKNIIQENLTYDYDVAIITAVEVESKAIKKLYNSWETIELKNDPVTYYKKEVIINEKKIKIVTAQQREMGIAAASNLTTKLLYHFKPKHIIMAGIAAGIGENKNYGDIIAAEIVWNYSNGKYIVSQIEKEDIIKFSPDPKTISISPLLHEKLSQDYKSILFKIKNDWPNNTQIKNELNLIIGPLACGNAVVANKKIVEELIKPHSRKTVGLDMESYGVFYAANNTSRLKTEFLCFKSICDFADSEKNDDYQNYSAYTSAEFTKYFIENVLINL